jgi:hypothetical protein
LYEFAAELYQTFKKELTPMLLKLFQKQNKGRQNKQNKTEKEGMLPKLIVEASINLISKLDSNTTRKTKL